MADIAERTETTTATTLEAIEEQRSRLLTGVRDDLYFVAQRARYTVENGCGSWDASELHAVARTIERADDELRDRLERIENLVDRLRSEFSDE